MVKIRDVAKMANVSLMTVSRVINNNGYVKAETREKVLSCIDELGYRPNLVARSLVTKSSKTIGVMYANIYNQIYSDQIMGIESVASEYGFTIMITNVHNYESACNGFSMLVDKQVDGIIVLPMELSGQSELSGWKQARQESNQFFSDLEIYLRQPGAKPMTLVTIDRAKGLANRVFMDYQSGTEMAVNYLISQGHRDIMFVGSVIHDSIWNQRAAGFSRAMKQNGLPIRIIETEALIPGGYEAGQRLMREGRLPGALYCANDLIAIGMMQAFLEKGIEVPKDISIMGHDGIAMGDILVPRLSTVSINGFETGCKAMQALMDTLEDRELKDITVSQTLLLRNSVAAIQD